VVLPELAEPQIPLPTSDTRRDLAEFDKLFQLPAARLRVVSRLASSASPWLANGEEVLRISSIRTAVAATRMKRPPLSRRPLSRAFAFSRSSNS
jgi:hypothetical protein